MITIEKTAEDILGKNKPETEQVIFSSAVRLEKCMGAVKKALPRNEFDQKIQKCLVDEVTKISRTIPEQVLLNYAPLLGAESDNLQQQLAIVDAFYFGGDGDLRNIDNSNPAVKAYAALATCLQGQKFEIDRTQNYAPDDALPKLETCTTALKREVKVNVQEAFVKGAYPGQEPRHEGSSQGSHFHHFGTPRK